LKDYFSVIFNFQNPMVVSEGPGKISAPSEWPENR
jgi:hypothetical protein